METKMQQIGVQAPELSEGDTLSLVPIDWEGGSGLLLVHSEVANGPIAIEVSVAVAGLEGFNRFYPAAGLEGLSLVDGNNKITIPFSAPKGTININSAELAAGQTLNLGAVYAVKV